jgi:hypothetical protein
VLTAEPLLRRLLADPELGADLLPRVRVRMVAQGPDSATELGIEGVAQVDQNSEDIGGLGDRIGVTGDQTDRMRNEGAELVRVLPPAGCGATSGTGPARRAAPFGVNPSATRFRL